MQKKNIAVLMGGYSSEAAISIKSGQTVVTHLPGELYRAYAIEITREGWWCRHKDGSTVPVNKADFSIELEGEKIGFDAAFNTIHGTPGEDGLIQAYLELMDVPQTASDFYQAALTFNKRDCISALKPYGVKTAVNFYLNAGDPVDPEAIIARVGLPCFVKANKAGSSFGISKVYKREALAAAIENSFKEDDEIIIESFLQGTEVSVGVVSMNNEVRALPVTEIVSDNDFFDYDAKYEGKSQEITPARITQEQTREVQNLAETIFKVLKLKGIARAEFIFHKGEAHFLEINTTPGLTPASIIPQQAKCAGMDLPELFSGILKNVL